LAWVVAAGLLIASKSERCNVFALLVVGVMCAEVVGEIHDAAESIKLVDRGAHR